MYQTGLYDFSVILISQSDQVYDDDDDLTIHSQMHLLFERSKKYPLLEVEATFERLQNLALKKKITCKIIFFCFKFNQIKLFF